MAHITVPDEPTATTFTVTTAQSVFAVTWTCFAKADIRVRVGSTELTQADFTFTGNPGTEGGFDGATITLNTTVSSTTVVIWRDIPVARTEDFGPGPVSSRDRNTALDRLTGMIQDREREGREAIRVPAGETGATLPPASVRANRFLAFNAAGQPIATAGGVTGVPVNILDFGIHGNGTTDDTAALQSALDAGVPLYWPRSAQVLADHVVANQPITIFAEDGARLIRRSAPASPTNALNAQLRLAHNVASGSLIRGGLIIDGNRDHLGGAHTIAAIWIGLRIDQCDDVTLDGIAFRKIASHGIFALGQSNSNPMRRHNWRNMKFRECSQNAAMILMAESTFQNMAARDCTNVPVGYSMGLETWQHAWEINTVFNSQFSGMTLDGYYPDGRGLDALCIGWTASRLFGCEVSGVRARNYTGTHPSGSVGMEIAGGTDLLIDGVYVDNFDNGFALNGVERWRASNVTCLGRNRGVTNAAAYAGIKITGAGYDFTWDGSLDVVMNAASKNGALSNVAASGFEVGALIRAQGVTISNYDFSGNRQYGSIVGQSGSQSSTMFPLAPAQQTQDITFDSGRAACNGFAGIYAQHCRDVKVTASKLSDNGQRGTIFPTGAYVDATAENVRFHGVNFAPAAGDTRTRAVSFRPGSTTGALNLYEVQTDGSSDLEIGRTVTIVNGGGAGVNLTGRVHDIFGNNVTLTFDSPTTFVETGNLQNIPGTVRLGNEGAPEASGNYLNGVGTDFETFFTGRTWIKVAGQYTFVTDILGPTRAIVELPLLVGPGTSAQAIRCDMILPNRQEAGVAANVSTTGLFISQDCDLSGQTVMPMSVTMATAENMANGSLYLRTGPVISVSGSLEHVSFIEIPRTHRVEGGQVRVVTEITGGGVGVGQLAIRQMDTTGAVQIARHDNLGLVPGPVGAVVGFGSFGPVAPTNGGRLNVVFPSSPTSGSIALDIRMIKAGAGA